MKLFGPPRVALLGLVALLAVAVAAPSAEEPVSGDDLLVVRWETRDLEAIERLSERFDLWSYLPDEGVAIFGVLPDELDELRGRGIPVQIDRERTLEALEALRRLRSGEGDGRSIPGFSCYRTVEETYADLATLAASRPGLAQWTSIGQSWERDILAELLSDGFESGDLCAWTGECSGVPGYEIGVLVLGKRSAPWPRAPFGIIAAMHAREYATAEVATRFAEELLAGYGVDPDATWILDHTEIHIVPQLNPDGRKQAEAGLFWRKNVDNQFCSDSSSRGVDLNRNSSFEWGGSGSSGSECSTTYRGPSPVSEPETRAIEEHLVGLFPDQRGPDPGDAAGVDATGVFISIHSAVPTILYPWEYSVFTPAPDEPGLRTFGLKMGHRANYTASQDGLSSAAGTTPDVAYGEYGVAAYTFEIGTTFFQSCASFESTVAPDNLEALQYAARAARRPYRAGLGPDVEGLVLTPQVRRSGGGFSPGSGPSVLPGVPVQIEATGDGTLYGSPTGSADPATPAQVAAVRYSIDLPPWLAETTEMAAADGSFGGTVEAAVATIPTGGLEPGRHLVFVEAEDVDGDVGPPRAVFLDIAEP